MGRSATRVSANKAKSNEKVGKGKRAYVTQSSSRNLAVKKKKLVNDDTDTVRGPHGQPTPETSNIPGEFFNVANYQASSSYEQNQLSQSETVNMNNESVAPNTGFLDNPCGLGLTTTTLPLGSSVNSHIKEKIWKGEFIDLSSLIPEITRTPTTGLGTLSIAPSGIITCIQQKSAQITSIEKWTDAFIIFISIFSAKHPDKVPELLKYMSIIRDTALKFPGGGWIEYDLQFRRRQACMPHRSWALIDGELWYTVLIPTAISGNTQLQHRSIDQPFRTRPSFQWPTPAQSSRQSGLDFLPRNPMPRFGIPRTDQKGTCWAYNRNACYANPCQWAHVCSKCRSPAHTIGNCRKNELIAPANPRM